METGGLPINRRLYMEQMIGFEPTPPVWKTGILTNYTTSACGTPGRTLTYDLLLRR